jgi:hypothetical protein
MSKRALEQYRVFPFIAWGLVIGFAFFVYTLTTELKETVATLETETQTLETWANTDPSTITEFGQQ